MRLDMSQQLRLSQQMRLAPRMIQSMEILQLPIMALEERIREEQEQNPALDPSLSTTETVSTDLEAQYDDTPASEKAERDGMDKEGPTSQEIDAFEKIVEDFNEEYIPSHQPSRQMGMELSDKKHDAMQNMADRPQSLEDHLLEQLVFPDEDEEVLDFARYVIANLNGRGFLATPLPELIESYDTSMGKKISFDQAEWALDIVQHLDPPGIAARDLRECLMLQLDDPDPTWQHADVMRTLVSEYLDDLEHNRLPNIQKMTSLPMETIREAIEEMRHLDLSPGAKFSSFQPQYVVPDVGVEQKDDGSYDIRVSDQNTPHIRLNKDYLQMLQNKEGSPEALEYIKKKVLAARWLMDAIEQRKATLEKVTRAIIEHQHSFLENGPDHIEPLKMQQIADKVGVHVTTVSRAVDDKWVQTPRGIFPLKRFFGGGTTTASGEEVAWDTIKRKLTEIIGAEDKHSPFSDDDLVKKLGEVGYPLARRTVTKYRKMLHIPSSRQRKQHT